MPILIACLSTGKGTWTQVNQLMKEPWEKIILVTNNFGKENFRTFPKNTEFIVIDQNKSAKEIRDFLIKELKPKIKSEVALNIESGTGKEHTALISALLNLGTSVKFIIPSKDGFEEV